MIPMEIYIQTLSKRNSATVPNTSVNITLQTTQNKEKEYIFISKAIFTVVIGKMIN
jgi:hypothetical protein